MRLADLLSYLAAGVAAFAGIARSCADAKPAPERTHAASSAIDVLFIAVFLLLRWDIATDMHGGALRVYRL